MNNRNETRPPICQNPIFPRPVWDDEPISTVSGMIDDDVDDSSSREGSVSHPEDTFYSVDQASLVFGTGGLVSSIWATGLFATKSTSFVPKLVPEISVEDSKEYRVSTSPGKPFVPPLPLQNIVGAVDSSKRTTDLSPRGIADIHDISYVQDSHEEMRQAVYAAEWVPNLVYPPTYTVPQPLMVTYGMPWMAQYPGPVTILPGMVSF